MEIENVNIMKVVMIVMKNMNMKMNMIVLMNTYHLIHIIHRIVMKIKGIIRIEEGIGIIIGNK